MAAVQTRGITTVSTESHSVGVTSKLYGFTTDSLALRQTPPKQQAVGNPNERIRQRLADEVGRLDKQAPFAVALLYPSPYGAALRSIGPLRISMAQGDSARALSQ